jgi:peptide/nickel transport system permease protein
VPVILVTDVLVWLLVAAVAGFAFYCRRHSHLAAPWSRVFSSRSALASLVVLCFYAAIGLVDSVHFRPALERQAGTERTAYSSEVLSLLDTALSHLRGRSEKTYSAPLATRSYAKEQTELPDGQQTRDFPRLRYGGAHLANEEELLADVFARIGLGLLGAAVCAVLIGLAVMRLQRWRPDVPWRTAGVTLLVILALALPAMVLARHYHVFGTDKVGQDVLYLALKSVRTSLVIGTVTTLVLLPLGIALGVMAGYFRGWIYDDAIQYLYTTLNSIPGVLLIAACVLMMQVFVDPPRVFDVPHSAPTSACSACARSSG